MISVIIRNQLFGKQKGVQKDRYPIPLPFSPTHRWHIGLTEEEAMKNGYSIHVARIPAAMIPRARTLHSIDGMLKAIVTSIPDGFWVVPYFVPMHQK